MILHAINCNYPYIVVTSRDTDVLVLLASQFKRIDCLELWMKAGTSKDPKNIPVHNVVTSFSPKVIKSLMPFHTLAGCDTTSFISRHTKKSIWNIFLLKYDLIKNLGKDNFHDSDFENIEMFFCILYGMPSETSINEDRMKSFIKKHISRTLSSYTRCTDSSYKKSALSKIWFGS